MTSDFSTLFDKQHGLETAKFDRRNGDKRHEDEESATAAATETISKTIVKYRQRHGLLLKR